MVLKSFLKKCLKKIGEFLNPPQKITVNIASLAPSKLLDDKTALITGGTSGIGKEIAQAFLNAGANVIITGRNDDKINDCIKELSEKYSPTKVFGIQLDNSDINSFSSKLQDIQNIISGKRIDILVNNAGVNQGGTYYCNENDYDNILNTNLKGAFFLSRFVADYMIENKIQGNILNIASSSSLRPADSPYNISKWGIRGLTLGLAKKLIKHGIVVNGLAPGPTATPMLIKDDTDNISLPNNPSKRYAMPQEIANMAVILTSGLGRMIVGDIVYMTGGAGLITFDDVNY